MSLKYRDHENTVQGAVYLTLRNNIMNLQLKPGTVMSTQEIATKLNVSRTPVREAFIRLQREGLVEIFPQKETVVSKINLDRVRQERFIRENLEMAVMNLAIQNYMPEDIVKLRKNIQAQKDLCQSKDYIGFLNMDTQFHKTFYEISKQQLAWETIKNVNGHYNRIRLMTTWSEEIIINSIKQHENIVNALEKKDIELLQKEVKYHLEKLIIEKNDIIKQYPEYFELNADEQLYDLSIIKI
ncbi:FCD domain-containing protein [Defluviitalea raffinosedens]|uniref:FCD domain-containing protein n=1 Tax=Defluviitalea raffinosedens TaxID=1450156 RepID=A0A7C8LQ59_9FIRM|nr:GntR family transcriptional regulator [Defluviitalea raffinosedens]KAE9634505.1 FCD domain-containing protein [Defluviitalea raffinosedens]